jgi:hypothetical protein
MAGPGGRICALRRVPTGLVVTNRQAEVAHEPNDVLSGLEHPQTVQSLCGPCTAKHPEELSGVVLVEVLAVGNKVSPAPHSSLLLACLHPNTLLCFVLLRVLQLLEQPVLARAPVCALRALNEAQLKAFDALKSNAQTAREQVYLDKLSALETALVSLQQAQAQPNNAKTAEAPSPSSASASAASPSSAAASAAAAALTVRDLDRMRVELNELALTPPLEAVARQNKDRLAAVVKEIRLLAYSKRAVPTAKK